MKWILVHIILSTGSDPIVIQSYNAGVFDDMNDCFWARDFTADEQGGEDGFFPINQQAVCVSYENIEVPLVDPDAIRG